MINQRLPEFNQVNAGRTSQLRIPPYALTLKSLDLRIGGTSMTLALMNELRLKLGSSPRWRVTGAQLAAILNYKGIAYDPLHVPVDFSERDMRNIVAEEIGGWDLSLLNDPLYFEVDINASASAPTMYSQSWFTPPQGTDKDKGQLVQKYVSSSFNANATGNTRNQLLFDPKGAIVKRAFCFYTGNDWTPTADGNLIKIEVKKNGGVVWELPCTDAREVQIRYKKNPQSKMYVVDFIVDNNMSGALRTADAKALEFNAFVTNADQLTVIWDVLDKPYNL